MEDLDCERHPARLKAVPIREGSGEPNTAGAFLPREARANFTGPSLCDVLRV